MRLIDIDELVYRLTADKDQRYFTVEEIREASQHVGKYIDIGTRVVRCQS